MVIDAGRLWRRSVLLEVTSMSSVLLSLSLSMFTVAQVLTSLIQHCIMIIIIIMVIFKCYFSGEHIALSLKKQQRCEHRYRKNQQIKSIVHDAN